MHSFLLLIFLVGCEEKRDAAIQFGEGLPIEPGMMVVPADELDSTVKLTLKFSIDRHLDDQVYVYFFRAVDGLPATTSGLPLTMGDTSGEGGAYHLSVLPSLIDDGVRFDVGFAAYGEDGKVQADLEEFFEVPLLKNAWGHVGEIRFSATWQAEQGADDQAAAAVE